MNEKKKKKKKKKRVKNPPINFFFLNYNNIMKNVLATGCQTKRYIYFLLKYINIKPDTSEIPANPR